MITNDNLIDSVKNDTSKKTQEVIDSVKDNAPKETQENLKTKQATDFEVRENRSILKTSKLAIPIIKAITGTTILFILCMISVFAVNSLF